MRTSLSIFILLSLSWVHVLTSPGLNCDDCDERRFCNCSAKHLLNVPIVPENVLDLDLSFNDIKSVKQKDLSVYGDLRTLNLHKNQLTKIHKDAFSSQLNLETLDLSFNNLRNVSASWFHKLRSLKHLNILGNQYTTVGSVPLFQSAQKLSTLKFGNPVIREVKRHVLSTLSHLDEMMFVGGSLRSYEQGSFRTKFISKVTLSLQALFQTDPALVSKILRDVSYPGTSLTVRDAVLMTNESVQPFIEVRKGQTARLTLRNMRATDEGVIYCLEALNGSPLTYLGLEDNKFKGGGMWGNASWTHFEKLRTIYVRNLEIQGFISFSSMLQLEFLLKHPTEISVINCTVFVIPCITSYLLKKLEYLDMSQNLLSDLTIRESLCDGKGVMHNLNVLNVSSNSLKSLGLMSHLVTSLEKLTFLDMSHNDFSTMPQKCTWPASLRFMNLSSTKLRSVTPCLPQSLAVLDVSENDLTVFQLQLPNLVELRLSGNRFLHFPYGGRFPGLKMLVIQRNTINMFNKTELMAFNTLQFLEAGHNNFVCTCEFVAFFKTDVDHLITLRDGHQSYVCDSPFTFRGQRVDHARWSVFECYMIPAVSILCVLIVLVLVITAVVCHKLHVLWYLQMTMAWLKAKRKPAIHRGGANLRYDAFVSYSQHDAEWVEEILAPELESSQPSFSLCLHKRDFLAGRWIVDNIIESIEKSYRTLFVLSEHFVTSEWCRYELDFSHFRIVDEHDDSAVLILLEPIPKETIPKRFCKLRKIMNSRTYLEWPQEDERKEEFWSTLRAVLKRDES
ncbi:toll-like receptor 2 [Trichomycterus rosablanca]|uniref:toll-like receptor 2 n=1 Tax=Trichomycterus rosablanca TaxID=2290929 RepID=UPI002F358F15